MGLEIFTSSGSFNPSTYGLKVGDLIQVLVVGGGGAGGGGRSVGPSGSASSFGSIASAAGGSGGDDYSTSSSSHASGGVNGGASYGYGGGGGGGGYVPFPSIPCTPGADSLTDSYGLGGAGGCYVSSGISDREYTKSLYGGSASRRSGMNGWVPFGGTPAKGGPSAKANDRGGGGAGGGYGAGGGGRGWGSNSYPYGAGGGGSGYIKVASHKLTSTSSIPVTIGNGGTWGEADTLPGGNGASGLVIVTW